MTANSECVLLLVFALALHFPSIYCGCNFRDYGYGGTVCVCNSNECDILPPLKKLGESEYVTYTSNKEGLRLNKDKGTIQSTNLDCVNIIKVNDDDEYQEIMGFGGAFTDSTGLNIESIPLAARQHLMRSYFSENGSEYNLCRVPIGGTDFSNRSYSYDDTANEDKHLNNFNLTYEDFQYKIPYILQALELSGSKLDLFASAWTVPTWMKTNKAASGILGFLKSDMYDVWARYQVKFLEAYDDMGVQFWGMTTGNEPSLALVPTKINSVAFNVVRYVGQHLGPALKNSKYSKIKLMIVDDQIFMFPLLPQLVLAFPSAAQYIDGMAVHWYYDSYVPAYVLSATHNNHPDRFILATEACNEADFGRTNYVELGSWHRGEKYGHNMIEDFNNYVTGWVDWNMVLNTEGGPTYISNFVDSPIIVNSTAGEFYKQPMYYFLAHFSKFVVRGSIKIGCTQFDSKVPATAFRRPDGYIVVIILNKKTFEVRLVISDVARGRIPLTVSAKSITTVVYNKTKSTVHQPTHQGTNLFSFLINNIPNVFGFGSYKKC